MVLSTATDKWMDSPKPYVFSNWGMDIMNTAAFVRSWCFCLCLRESFFVSARSGLYGVGRMLFCNELRLGETERRRGGLLKRGQQTLYSYMRYRL